MSTTLQDTLKTLADGAAARAGRSDDEAHRATLDGLLGTVRRRRAVRHTGTAVAGASLVAALAVGGSQLTGGRGARSIPGATGPGAEIGPGGLNQAQQLALVNNLGIECGKPFTLKMTEVPNLAPISTIDAARVTRGTDYEVAVAYTINGPGATSVLARFSMAAVIVRDGTVVGFAAGRPLPGSLEEDDGTDAILRLRMPSLMNCSGPDTPAPDGQYEMYNVEGRIDDTGATQVTGVLGTLPIAVPDWATYAPQGDATPDVAPGDGTVASTRITDPSGALGRGATFGTTYALFTPPALDGKNLVVRFNADGSVPHDADGTVPLWTSSLGLPSDVYTAGGFTATWVPSPEGFKIMKDGVTLVWSTTGRTPTPTATPTR